MKWLGLIGGTTWHSTAGYYAHLNRLANEKLGGVSSAQIILASVDFGEVSRIQQGNNLDETAPIILDAAHRLRGAGADCIMLCANTMNYFADQAEAATGLQVIHIVDATAAAIKQAGLKKVALLGTRFTMEMAFYRDRLANHGITAITPDQETRQYMHHTIHDQMALGNFSDEVRERYVRIIDELVSQGAEGVIYGCTEIPILMEPVGVSVPAFDTMLLHAEAGSAYALS